MRKANAFSNQTWVCQDQKSSRPKGYFFGDSPLNFPTPILHVQLSISALLTAFFQLILNPLGQTAFISQMLVGIILGPSVLGSGNAFADIVFPLKSFYISETYALFGVMLFVFLVGVKMDISLVKQSGRKAVVIGLSAFFVPLILNIGFALVLRKTVAMEASLHKSIIIIAVFQCLSSFHIISCLLADLNLLNSEIGRLAVSSSIVSGVLSLIWVGLAFTIRQSKISKKDLSLPFMGLSLFCMFILIVYILRPMMLWMVAQLTDKEKSVKESYIFSIFIMIMVCSLLGEVMGQHCILGPMILGLAVPDGPPLGSALVEKLDSYVSLILLPSYFVVTGARINFSMIKMKTVWILELLVMSSFCGILIGTMVPSLYCKMSPVDSFSLGLIMSAQGIIDLIDEEAYSIMVLSAFFLTAIITPILKYLYNPSKRYMSTKRRTIEHALPNAELRILACIYQEDSTPSIINLLEVTNPTPQTPICFYVVHLVSLSGRTAPVFITHRLGKRSFRTFQSGDSDRIVNAFRLYEEHSSEHPNVSLTVVRLVDNRKFNVHKEHDSELLSKCKIAIAGRKQHVYKEERVKDSVDMINVIRSMQNFYDLIVVGRRHDCDSPLFMGLKEWNEFPELGFIGDMLASSDSNCEVSVLVVQQQMLGNDQQMVDHNSFKSNGTPSFSVVDMPRDDRVHPLRY
ncbi:hypothetical protein C1H46_035644 [Malus baccata]|uniref:Uncharacterized protein n=1 Tax=Malus baccata TaxID=106549 RepID=A0A540KX63_MALBA|nr:hypothetical protein C1H46_035644 [Malus baccata]